MSETEVARGRPPYQSVGDDELKPLSVAGRVLGAVSSVSALRILEINDSFGTGSNTAPGGKGTRLYELLRGEGIPARFVGPVSRGRAGYPVPADPMCGCYPGETIAQLAARCQAGGSIFLYVAQFGAPDVVILGGGTNDVAAGRSAAQIQTDRAAMRAAVRALCPNSWVIELSIGPMYTPAAPVGGLVAANATIVQSNADRAIDAPAFGARWMFRDVFPGVGPGDFSAVDGTHPKFGTHALGAGVLFGAIRLIAPVSRVARMPRPFRYRTKFASPRLTNKSADQILTTADNGWRLPAGNFLIGGEFALDDLASVGGNPVTLIQACPAGLNYNHGLKFAYDAASNPPTLLFYGMGAGPIGQSAAVPVATGGRYFMAAHGDYAAGIVSFWMGLPMSAAAGAPYTLACVGVSTGVAQWAQGDANPLAGAGFRVTGGFGGSCRNLFMRNANVPGFEGIRDDLEAMYFDGTGPKGASAWLPCDEAAGTTCASAVGGAAGAFAAADWPAAGTYAWPYDE